MEDVLDELGRVIREQRGSLTRLARRESLSPEDAVDAVHDAFCTFLRLSLRRDRIESVPSYLAEIVKNAARNKRRLHHVSRPHDAIEEVSLADDTSAETLVAEAEEHVRLRACVDRLCDTQKAVVTLRMLEEKAGEDVAQALGISRGHVDVLLHRAKVSLRACMLE